MAEIENQAYETNHVLWHLYFYLYFCCVYVLPLFMCFWAPIHGVNSLTWGWTTRKKLLVYSKLNCYSEFHNMFRITYKICTIKKEVEYFGIFKSKQSTFINTLNKEMVPLSFSDWKWRTQSLASDVVDNECCPLSRHTESERCWGCLLWWAMPFYSSSLFDSFLKDNQVIVTAKKNLYGCRTCKNWLGPDLPVHFNHTSHVSTGQHLFGKVTHRVWMYTFAYTHFRVYVLYQCPQTRCFLQQILNGEGEFHPLLLFHFWAKSSNLEQP